MIPVPYRTLGPWPSYPMALLTSWLALLLSARLPWAFGEGPFLLPLLLPILAASLYGGLGPALLALVVCGLGAAWVIPPGDSFAIAAAVNAFRLALLLATSLVLILLLDWLRRERHTRSIAFAEVTAERARFEAVFEQAAVGMAVVAPDGRWLRVNRKLCEILGYSEQQLRERTFQNLTHTDDLQTGLDLREQLFSGAIPSISVEKRYLRRDGSTIWTHLTVALKRNTDGSPEYMISVVEDISARRDTEDALRQALAQARDANAASRAKSLFLTNMSHEIRTPMNAILGATQMLKVRLAAEEFGELLDMQERAGKHLLAVVSDVLDLKRIEAGRLQLDETNVDLETLLRHTLAMVEPDARAKGLDLRLDLQCNDGPLLGDPIRLQQALLNYLGNAIKFTDAGHVVLRVSRQRADAAGVSLRFTVEDTGIGIAPENLPLLFTPFEQANSDIARRHGGSGLGLALTQRLAQMMGGNTGVSSEPGVGSTFWFTARLRRGSTPVPVAPTATADMAAGLHALLVDDDPVNLQVLGMMAEHFGLVVTSARSGEDALAAAAQAQFDIVLMDIHMPGLSGLETVPRLRALPGYRTVPIIAVSAGVFEEEKAQALAAGFNGFLPKPLELDAFARTLETHLTAHSRRVQVPDHN